MLIVVAVISNRTPRSKSRCGRDPSEMVPRRQDPKSMTVSVILLIAVFTFIIAFIVALSIIVGRPASTKRPTRPVTSSGTPEVTLSACHVVGNGTTCFRFESKFTARLCSAVDGVFVNINSSLSSSSSSSSSSAAASSTTCYHNICTGYVVDNRFCFLNRLCPLSPTHIYPRRRQSRG